MEWVEVLSSLSGQLPINTTSSANENVSVSTKRPVALDPHLPRYIFRLKDFKRINIKQAKEVRFSDENSYAFIVFQDDYEDSQESLDNKKQETIRYEYWKDGSNHCVTISFLPQDLNKDSLTPVFQQSATPFGFSCSSNRKSNRLSSRRVSAKNFKSLDLTPSNAPSFKRTSVVKLTLVQSSSSNRMPPSLQDSDCISSLSSMQFNTQTVLGSSLFIPCNYQTINFNPFAKPEDSRQLEHDSSAESSLTDMLVKPNCSEGIKNKITDILASMTKKEISQEKPKDIETNFQFISAPTISISPRSKIVPTPKNESLSDISSSRASLESNGISHSDRPIKYSAQYQKTIKNSENILMKSKVETSHSESSENSANESKHSQNLDKERVRKKFKSNIPLPVQKFVKDKETPHAKLEKRTKESTNGKTKRGVSPKVKISDLRFSKVKEKKKSPLIKKKLRRSSPTSKNNISSKQLSIKSPSAQIKVIESLPKITYSRRPIRLPIVGCTQKDRDLINLKLKKLNSQFVPPKSSNKLTIGSPDPVDSPPPSPAIQIGKRGYAKMESDLNTLPKIISAKLKVSLFYTNLRNFCVIKLTKLNYLIYLFISL